MKKESIIGFSDKQRSAAYERRMLSRDIYQTDCPHCGKKAISKYYNENTKRYHFKHQKIITRTIRQTFYCGEP